MHLIFLESRITDVHFAADNMSLSSFNFFSGGLRKTISTIVRFGRSRSPKVIDLGANRKLACDFLLVRNSNLGPILHHFGDCACFVLLTPPLFHPNLGGVPVEPDRPCWGQS